MSRVLMLLFDAGDGGPEVPRGPAFMSPEWCQMYKHAVREADRLGIVLSVNLCSGWDDRTRSKREADAGSSSTAGARSG